MSIEDVRHEIDLIADHNYNKAELVRIVLNAMLNFANDGITQNTDAIGINTASIGGLNTFQATISPVVASHTSEFTTVDTTLAEYNTRLLLLEAEEQNSVFHYYIKDKIQDTTNSLKLWYSFKGVVGKYVNYTFCIEAIKDFTDDTNTPFIFKVGNADLVAVLAKILNKYSTDHRLSFVVSSSNPSKNYLDYQKMFTTTFELEGTNPNSGIIHRFYPFNIIESDGAGEQEIFKAGDTIFTSVEMHCPDFTFDR